MSVSEFSASRWTTACREWEGGRNSERPSELGEGRCKNKAEKGTQTEVGGSKSRESLSSSGGKCHWNHIKFAVCERELLAYKAYDLVMGLWGGSLAVSINPQSHGWARLAIQTHPVPSVYLKDTSGVYQLQQNPPFCFHSPARLTPSSPAPPLNVMHSHQGTVA